MSAPTALDALRGVGLRPTIARIAILQVMQSVSPRALSSDDMFRELMLRGSRTSIGTVYRTMHELHAKALLQKDSDSSAPARYRLREADQDNLRQVNLISREDGQVVELHDDELYATLLEVARLAGVDLSGQQLNIKYDATPPPAAHATGHMLQRRQRLI